MDSYMIKFSENEEEETEIALLSNGKAISYILTEITDTSKYETVISAYKKDNGLQNATISSVEAFEVLNPTNDEKSVILVVHSVKMIVRRNEWTGVSSSLLIIMMATFGRYFG